MRLLFNQVTVITLISFLLVACSKKEIIIENAVIRAIPESQTVTAAYMKISNGTDKDKVLISINSDIAKQIELHQHNQVNGMMQMRQVMSVVIPAHDSFTFKQGGHHIMLIDVDHNKLQIKNQISLSLSFKDGSEKQIKAIVTGLN